MPLQFTTIEEPSFARGIDARSAENQIQAGFARDLVNVDIVESRIRKRKGYASYAGGLPIRVQGLTQSSGKLSFVLDSSIDLSRVIPGPLLVYGKSGSIATDGPFTTAGNTYRYYPTWLSNLRKTMTIGTGTITAIKSEHNIDSDTMFVGLAQSTTTGDKLSGNTIFADSVTIDDTSNDISVTYSNGTSSAIDTFLYYKDQSSIVGKSFNKEFTLTFPVGENTLSYSIEASEHQLNNFNIVYQLYLLQGGGWTQIKPDSFTVDSATGEVTLEITRDLAGSPEFKIVLSAVPNSQVFSSINLQNNKVIIPNVSNPFLFFTVYERDISGTLTEIMLGGPIDQGPFSSFNDDTKEWTLSWNASVPGNIEVCYEYGSVRANQITVDDVQALTSDSDKVPQLVIYGLSHASAYGNEKSVNRRGWVNHIDSYRSPKTVHVVSGLGGNLFAALTSSQVSSNTEVNLLPTWFANLNIRTGSSAQVIGPAFCDLPVGTSSRTGGYYSFNGGIFGWAVVTAVAYQPSGDTKYRLHMPGGFKNGATPVVAGDLLTVEKMSHSRHSGTFEIVSVDDSTLTSDEYIEITVKNPKLTSSDYDDNATAGKAGVFTDRIELAGTSPFLENDRLLSSSWGDETDLTVYDSSGNTVLVSQCYNYLTLSAGLVLTGARRSNTVSLRNINNEPTVNTVVAGDVLYYSELERELTVISVNAVANTVTFDETIDWYDDLSLPPQFTVARRWFPIEVPVRDATDELVPLTSVSHFESNSYDNQPFLRSAMVLNNMYLTNGDDEVYKYDGQHLYRAGIIPWQPGLFAAVENVGSGGIVLPVNETVDPVAVTGNTLVFSADDAAKFRAGDIIEVTLPAGPVQLTISSKEPSEDGTTVSFYFNETLSGFTNGASIAAGNIVGVYYASYYFKLNIKDRNGVTTTSAVTGDDSFVVTLAPTTDSGQVVNLRLVRLPPWDQYDYRAGNIELEIYRTLWTTGSIGASPKWYKLKTEPLTFAVNSGYIDFRDTYSNDTLQSGEEDLVSSVLTNIVPFNWDEPVRSKYVTTVGNRLVLANVTSWPTLTVNFLANKDTAYTDFAGQKFLFKKDASASIDDTTNMVNNVTYELVNGSSAKEIYPVTGTSGHFMFATTTSFPSEVTEGSWVYLYHNTVSSGQSQLVQNNTGTGTNQSEFNYGSLPNGTLVHFRSSTNQLPSPLVANRGYFVVDSDSNSFRVSATRGNPFIPLTTVGTNVSVLWDGSELDRAGWYQVASIDSGIITINSPGTTWTTIPTQFPDRALFATSPRDVPVLLGVDGNMAMTSGNGPVPYLNVIRRLGMAINATMRVTDTTLTEEVDQSKFVPWLTAQSELFTNGTLIVRRPRADAVTPSLEVTDGDTSKYKTYVNDEPVTAEATLARTTRYPSRVLLSYDSYPEIFSNPFSFQLSDSDSAVDINAADGQEITGIVPFFGTSAFGAAQQGGVLVAFKQNSIYVINPATRAVERLETQGLGCTAPYSIASTRDGIAFANESGIYVLRRDFRIEYIGRYMERNWQDRVDLDYLSIAQGHHYNVGRQYKLSVPMVENSINSYAENEEVYVYAYTGETDEAPGGWTRYANHAATGWCNLFQEAFFADVNGNVQRIRNTGEASDYRDGNAAIISSIETRFTAFDNTAIRKAVSNVVVHYRTNVDSSSTSLGMAIDMASEYQASSSYKVITTGPKDGLSSQVGQLVVSVMHSFPKRKCVYAGVKIVNSGLDENVEVAGMSYVVAGLGSGGIKQAAETEG